jgi:hypothetical protein
MSPGAGTIPRRMGNTSGQLLMGPAFRDPFKNGIGKSKSV